MADGQNWQVRQAEAGDVAALSLVGTATFLETFAGVLHGTASAIQARLPLAR